MKSVKLLALILLSNIAVAQNSLPVLSNVSTVVGGGAVTITYDLSDTENNPCDVQLLISADGGQTYLTKTGTISGDAGTGIVPGTGRQLVWNYDTISNIYDYSLRLVADDKQVPDIQTIVDQVDSVRLRSNLEFIQGIRHYQAAPSHLEDVKDTILVRFQNAGLQTYTQDFTNLNYLGQNIIGRKPGLGQEDSTYIVDAHFDSVNDAPGADDNGSGVSGVLEVLRVLAPYNFSKSIRFIGFDFEETGLDGSVKYVQSGIPAWEKIKGVLNFEMIGYYTEKNNSQQVPSGFNILFPTQYAQLVADTFKGNFIVNVGDQESGELTQAYQTLSQQYVPALKTSTFVLPGNGTIAMDFRRSDHAPFWDADVPAIMLTDGANFRNQNYHEPSDTIGVLSFTFMSDVVKGTVATIASLAGLQHSTYRDIDIAPNAIPRTSLNCGVTLYPVPVGNMLTIETNECLGNNYTLQIMNTNGSVVFTEQVTAKNKVIVPTDKLAAGTYFAVLQSANGTVTKRFIK
ncbi:MAG TPA: M28 family peptidase [Chitinophagales bacterium]|nr:M28 family peptidase [Chitinophagales bacterium]